MKIKMLTLFFTIATLMLSCKKDVHVNAKIDAIEPNAATENEMITVTGSGLQNIRSAVLDLGNVPIAINQNFNTDKALLFRIPANANIGAQHVVFTNSEGNQYSVAFTVTF